VLVVYALLLTDCTAFKVGFSCNPLQRVYAFHRRYFEAFDLDQSTLLRVQTSDDARKIETTLKRALAPNRVEVPSWVALEAGGVTEWFSAVYFNDAISMLQQDAPPDIARLIDVRSQLEAQLRRYRGQFELWVIEQFQQIERLAQFPKTMAAARDQQLRLRDWIDAYRWLGVDLFVENPHVGEVLERVLAAHL
jgi:hypothetical protein